MPRRSFPDPAELVPLLLTWFRAHARDLPWRRTSDPYAIWISEIMLQQTQVKTVIPYWKRWLRELPGVTALAGADEDRVLKLWEGLGYYSRARNLRAAARLVVERHQGQFPRTVEELVELPGIGRYTAGAIASIAFNEPAPILDGNVIRILTRIGAIRGDPRERKRNQHLWKLASRLVEEAARSRAGGRVCSDLNQALMELGATVCSPRAPACPACPVRHLCQASLRGHPAAFPETPPRAAVESRYFAVAVLEQDGRFLVRRRPPGSVNAGLWEFPQLELADVAADRRKSLQNWLQGKPAKIEPLISFQHSITRYRMHLEVFRLELDRGRPPLEEEGTVWVTLADLDQLALTAAHRKVAQLIGGS